MRRLRSLFFCASLVLCAPVAFAGEGDDELAAAGRAIDASPDSPAAYDAFAQLAFKYRRWDDAVTRLRAAVVRLPSYHAGLYKLAYAYRQQKDYVAAAAAYRRFAELEPGRADAYFGLGAALQGAGDRAGALEAYRRYIATEKSPEKQKFVDQAKAEIARLEGTPAAPPAPAPTPAPPPTARAAPPPLTPAPAPAASAPRPPLVTPPAADAVQLRATAERLRQSGKLDDAAQAYERALAADPGNLDLHVELGDVYFAQRRYVDAARVFRSAIERDGGYALGWYNLAHAESRAGEHNAAVRAYREYIRLRPSDPDPFYGLGQTYKAMGDRKGAIDAFRTYLQMERRPESQRWVDKARRELESLEGAPHADRGRARDLKNPFEDRPGYASADDLLPPSMEGSGRREHERIVREIAADDILPIEADDSPRGRAMRDLKDPFADEPTTLPTSSRERLARYASALAAYRAALDRHATEVGALYQRGAERVLANDLRGAQRAWTAQIAADRAVEEARVRLERAREQLTR